MHVFVMQKTFATSVAACLFLALSFHAYGTPTPTEQKIAFLRESAEKTPDYKTYNDLARALVVRVRESGNVAHYADAERALVQSQKIASDNLEAESIAVSILLGKREFKAALEKAHALNKKVPDDLEVYGHIVDAAAALGKYDVAERAAQWMLDLRSSAPLSLTRAAYLREEFGDVDGAIDLMQRVYPRIAPQDTEARAWHLTRMASMFAGTGKTTSAESAALAALALLPDYHPALGQLARVRLSQRRHAEAVTLERKRAQLVSHPENSYALAKALAAAGKEREARLAYAEFEREALKRMHQADNANRELVYYYIDYKRTPTHALTVAALEIARRRDAQTLEAYAWALHANGRRAEARQELQAALAGGICGAGIVNRARMVAAKPAERSFATLQPCADMCCRPI